MVSRVHGLPLSEFCIGFYLTSCPKYPPEYLEEGTFLPVMTFNPDCLVPLNGKSVVARLIENCDYVVIEDTDLQPIREHTGEAKG